MKYLSTVEAAEKWNISDRRIRTLCKEGRISGAKKQGNSYKIPADAQKPVDGRIKCTGKVLKWNDIVIASINDDYSINWIEPKYNSVVNMYTHGAREWSSDQFNEFLLDRIVSRDRRDIEKILFRCGLSNYDVRAISEITRGIHPRDMLWIANTPDESMQDVVTDVFESVFVQKLDMQGDSIDTPEGYNIKRYGVYNGKYGIYKQRISPLATDLESEIAVYKLAEVLGVPCCSAYKIDENTMFSEFEYDFSKEYIVHFRRLFDGKRGENEYENLIKLRPQFKKDIIKMILLDFITRQDDRHLSNMAIKINENGESFYPLYDNGRSLFYEDTEEFVEKACEDISKYATTFGYAGSYWDHIQDIRADGVDFSKLINLDIDEKMVREILLESGFKTYRLEGATKWVINALSMLK